MIKKKKKKIEAGQLAEHIVIIILLFLVLFPFYILIVNSLKLPKDILKYPFAFPGTAKAPLLVTGYGVAWSYIKGYILNTFIIAVMEVVGSLIVPSMAAFGFTRYKFKGREALFMVFLAFMMIPGILTLASQFSLVYTDLHLGQTFWGVALPAIAGGIPMGVFLIKTFFEGISDTLFEAASLDGANALHQYFILAIPLSLPILFTIGLSTLLGAWNDMIWARLILYGREDLYTISIGVFVSFNTSANKSITDTVVYAGYVIASIPLVLAFALTSKQFIKGLTNGAIKM